MATLSGLISVRVKDANSAKTATATTIQSVDTSSLANIVTRAQTLATNMDAVMDAQITSIRLELDLPLPGGIKTTPVAGSDITQTGTLNFSDSAGLYSAPFVIPGLANAVVVGGKINLTDTNIIALKTFLLSASTVLQFVSRALNVFVALLDALFSFRKRRKAIARRSFP